MFSNSKFRMKFRLDSVDQCLIEKKGLSKIHKDAHELVLKRLSPENPIKDGKQTPFKGHPVFKAQHATATCCRRCLQKWHKIPKGVPLNNEQISFIVALIMKWIEQQSSALSKNKDIGDSSQKPKQLSLF